jgi:hypothetical protein
VDEALRRSAAASVTAAVGLLITVPLAGVSVVAGAALVGISCHPAWWTVTAVGLTVVAIAALALAVACASALTLGWRDVPAAIPADR